MMELYFEIDKCENHVARGKDSDPIITARKEVGARLYFHRLL